MQKFQTTSIFFKGEYTSPNSSYERLTSPTQINTQLAANKNWLQVLVLTVDLNILESNGSPVAAMRNYIITI